MGKESIAEKYKKQHDTLSEAFYIKKRGQGVTAQEQIDFDSAHGNIFRNMNNELMDMGYKEPPTPPRDLGREIDELKQEIEKLRVK